MHVAALLLALSLLPQVLFVDHAVSALLPAQDRLTIAGHDEHGAAHDHDDARATGHSVHCHGVLGACSELPMTSGPGQLLGGGSQYIAPLALSELGLPIGEAGPPADFIAEPNDEPPRPFLLP